MERRHGGAAGGVRSGHWWVSLPDGRDAEGTYAAEVYATVRQLVFAEGPSRREVVRRLGLGRDAVGTMCRSSEPPGHARTKPVERPRPGPLTEG